MLSDVTHTYNVDVAMSTCDEEFICKVLMVICIPIRSVHMVIEKAAS